MQSHFAVSHTGIIVTVEPTMGEKQQIVVPDGEPASMLHVTLAYLGDVETEAPDRDAVVDACRDVAGWFAPLTGEVTGFGTFGPVTDEQPQIGLIDVVGLTEMRTRLVDRLGEGGVACGQHHGFTPHLTLRYGPGDIPEDRIGMALTFDTLRCRWGGVAIAFPFTGDGG